MGLCRQEQLSAQFAVRGGFLYVDSQRRVVRANTVTDGGTDLIFKSPVPWRAEFTDQLISTARLRRCTGLIEVGGSSRLQPWGWLGSKSIGRGRLRLNRHD
jgi:hypothetical protein